MKNNADQTAAAEDIEEMLHEIMNNQDAVKLGLCTKGYFEAGLKDMRKISDYIRTLQAEHREMRRILGNIHFLTCVKKTNLGLETVKDLNKVLSSITINA